MAKFDFMTATKAELDKHIEDKEKSNEKITEFFSKEREEWSKQLLPLYKTLSYRDMNKIADLQAETLSLRHRIQDKISEYMSSLSKQSSYYKKSWADKIQYYHTGFGIKLSSTEKKEFVNRDLREDKVGLELMETHIEFLRECRYSCDQIQYAVKNLIGLMAYV